VQAAGGFTSPSQAQALATQIDGLLQSAIGVANTKYAGKYVFAGTGGSTTAPIVANGQPVSSVTFNGNFASQNETLYNGQSVSTSVTLQQAFNFNAPDGSPDVFKTLINLRNTLANGTVVSESASRVNAVNQALTPGTALNMAGVLVTPLVADGNGNVDISITSSKAPNGVTIPISLAGPPAATMTSVLAAINAQTGNTGVTASFDYKQQRLVLSSSGGAFQVTDTASAGSSTTGNFVTAFGLQSQANLQTDVSRQLGDIDKATQTLLNGRATVGGNLQTLTALGTATDSQVVNDTKIQSGIEDADIAKVISQFSQTQTALQAAYGTTTRLESKTLFDYLQ
jgi:flagellar hook-associated protein 3 FlgL